MINVNSYGTSASLLMDSVSMNKMVNQQNSSQIQGVLSSLPKTNSIFDSTLMADIYDAKAMTIQVIRDYNQKVDDSKSAKSTEEVDATTKTADENVDEAKAEKNSFYKNTYDSQQSIAQRIIARSREDYSENDAFQSINDEIISKHSQVQ